MEAQKFVTKQLLGESPFSNIEFANVEELVVSVSADFSGASIAGLDAVDIGNKDVNNTELSLLAGLTGTVLTDTNTVDVGNKTFNSATTSIAQLSGDPTKKIFFNPAFQTTYKTLTLLTKNLPGYVIASDTDVTNNANNIATNAANLASHEAATEAHGATGEVVGTTNTQTLSNKTLASPTITGTITLEDPVLDSPQVINGNSLYAGYIDFFEASSTGSNYVRLTAPTNFSTNYSVTLPTESGGLVGRTATQTLTHKTLDAPSVLDGEMERSVFMDSDSGIPGMTYYREASGSGSNYVSVQAPASLSGNMALTLPEGIAFGVTSDTLVGESTPAVLTGKTLTAPTMTSFVSGGTTFTMPSGGSADTMVARNTSETLTNKTMDHCDLDDCAVGGAELDVNTVIDMNSNQIKAINYTAGVKSKYYATTGSVSETYASEVYASNWGATTSTKDELTLQADGGILVISDHNNNTISDEATYGAFCLLYGSDPATDRIFKVRASGATYADGAYSSSGADYAEYFQCDPSENLRVGETVVVDQSSGLVRRFDAVGKGDIVTNIIGVVRPKNGNMSCVGNSAEDYWHARWLKDDFGEYLMERRDSPVEKGVYNMVRKRNPQWDPSVKYIPRSERDEWVVIGLMGQIPVRAGSHVNPRWISMRRKNIYLL